MLAQALGMDTQTAGMFLGATIHDVARAVGDTATLVKLMRVVCLLPVILIAVAFTRGAGETSDGSRPPLLPWFAVGFALLVAVDSSGWLATALARSGSDLSGWFLVAAMAGIGMKTQLRELIAVGLKPVVLMVGETVLLAALAIARFQLDTMKRAATWKEPPQQGDKQSPLPST